jgi:hypothetical protein
VSISVTGSKVTVAKPVAVELGFGGFSARGLKGPLNVIGAAYATVARSRTPIANRQLESISPPRHKVGLILEIVSSVGRSVKVVKLTVPEPASEN